MWTQWDMLSYYKLNYYILSSRNIIETQAKLWKSHFITVKNFEVVLLNKYLFPTGTLC